MIAIDIQRGRDVGLGTLNETREAIGLPPYKSFAALTSDPVLQGDLKDVYGSIENVDLFMGGLAERHMPGAVVGATFQAIIARQFQALRTGDQFFWRNQGFDAGTASMIANTSLADIIERNADATNLQRNVFLVATQRHAKPHVPPSRIDTRRRHRPPALIDGL